MCERAGRAHLLVEGARLVGERRVRYEALQRQRVQSGRALRPRFRRLLHSLSGPRVNLREVQPPARSLRRVHRTHVRPAVDAAQRGGDCGGFVARTRHRHALHAVRHLIVAAARGLARVGPPAAGAGARRGRTAAAESGQKAQSG